jgi:hypothetical protein
VDNAGIKGDKLGIISKVARFCYVNVDKLSTEIVDKIPGLSTVYENCG